MSNLLIWFSLKLTWDKDSNFFKLTYISWFFLKYNLFKDYKSDIFNLLIWFYEAKIVFSLGTFLIDKQDMMLPRRQRIYSD